MLEDRKINLNKNQDLAVKNINENLIVNAGAGTGKTMVLVERFLEILDKGDLEEAREVESIVAITFTKKAAQEMINRIRARLRENFPKGDKWKRFYHDIEKANISTIHSFCGNILRENTVELGIDPKFKILDENLSENLLKETIQELLLLKIGEDKTLYTMLKDLDLISLGEAGECFFDLYNKLRNDGFQIGQVESIMETRLKNLKIGEDLINKIRSGYQYLMENMAKNARIHKLKEDETYLRFLGAQYESDEDLLEILDYLLDFTNTTSKKFKACADEIRKDVNRAKQINEVKNKDYYRKIIGLLRDIDKKYREKKEDVSGLDYDDLQIYVNNLLDNGKYRAYYQDKYKYLMVDEFQDSNELQREIFYKLASRNSKLDRNNLFIVGDPKQSIYGFRGGDLDVYYSVLEDIGKLGGNNLIGLDENYRTNENIMEFINYIFKNLMDREYSRLNPNIRSKEAIEVEVLNKEDLEIPREENSLNYSRTYEGELIAKRILELVGTGDYKFKDVAILFRARTRVGIYEKILGQYNIPYYNLSGTGLFKSQEVIDLLNGFKAFLNPKDLISNIGFLRSPIIGLSDEEIYLLMMEEGGILDRLKLYAKRSYVKDKELITTAINIYEHLSKLSHRLNSYEFLRELVEITNYKELVLVLDQGRQKYGNIEKVLNIFLNYENEGIHESYNILSYIEELEKRDIGQANIVSEKEDAVRILTIHKAKGLEFPVVILPELASGNINRTSKILYDKKLGLGLDIEGQNGFYNNLKELYKKREEGESLRVLYVAMTRAKNLLILGNQGRARGFKKILEGYLNKDFTRTISAIDGVGKAKASPSYINEGISLESSLYPRNLIEFKDYDKFIIDKFSISQFMKFKKCKREYYFDRYLRLDEKIISLLGGTELKENTGGSISALDKGNIIHRFCELYRKDTNKEHLIKKLIIEFGYGEEIIPDLEIYIDNYTRDYREDYHKVYREKEFNIAIKNGKFTGVIDRINIKNGEIEIIDYKTNKAYNKEAIYKEYKDQIRFYAYVVGNIFKKRVKTGKLQLLESGEFLKIDLSEGKINKTIKEIEDFVEFVSMNETIESYKPSKNCNEYCRYYNLCSRDRL